MKAYIRRSILCLFTLLGVLALGLSSARAEEKAAVMVGVSVPLTGDGASIGNAVKNGVQLAYDEFSPELQAKIKVSFQDDQNSPKNAVSAFTKLVKSDKAAVIISTASNTSKVTAPLADREKIPQISIATDTAVSAGRTHVVNFWASAKEEAIPAVEESLRRGYKNIAVISTIHDLNMSCRKAYEEESAGRIKFVLNEEFTSDVKDFRSYLTKLRAAGQFDAIFVNLFLGQIGVFAKQAREMGFKQDLFTFELFEETNEVKNSNGALINQWYAQAGDPSDGFIKKYEAKFPGAPLLGAANGYDALNLIAAAVKQGKDSSATMNEYFHTAKDVSGALGTYSATGRNTFSLPATLKVVKENGFEKLHP